MDLTLDEVVKHISNINHLLSDVEVQRVHDHIFTTDTEISHIDDQLSTLTQKRAQLLRDRHIHATLIAPIRKLPNELLSHFHAMHPEAHHDEES